MKLHKCQTEMVKSLLKRFPRRKQLYDIYLYNFSSPSRGGEALTIEALRVIRCCFTDSDYEYEEAKLDVRNNVQPVLKGVTLEQAKRMQRVFALVMHAGLACNPEASNITVSYICWQEAQKTG